MKGFNEFIYAGEITTSSVFGIDASNYIADQFGGYDDLIVIMDSREPAEYQLITTELIKEEWMVDEWKTSEFGHPVACYKPFSNLTIVSITMTYTILYIIKWADLERLSHGGISSWIIEDLFSEF